MARRARTRTRPHFVLAANAVRATINEFLSEHSNDLRLKTLVSNKRFIS